MNLEKLHQKNLNTTQKSLNIQKKTLKILKEFTLLKEMYLIHWLDIKN